MATFSLPSLPRSGMVLNRLLSYSFEKFDGMFGRYIRSNTVTQIKDVVIAMAKAGCSNIPDFHSLSHRLQRHIQLFQLPRLLQ